eukprot:scaffold52718_cov337-Isochrysis_galbana.AAC.1
MLFTEYELSNVSLLSLEPAGGPVDTPLVLVITGSNFVDFGLKCRVGTETADAELLDSTRVRCRVPAAATPAVGT